MRHRLAVRLRFVMLLAWSASMVHPAPVRDGRTSTVLMDDKEQDRILAAGGDLQSYGQQGSSQHETRDPRVAPGNLEAIMPFNQKLFDMAFPEDTVHDKELLEPFVDDTDDEKALEAAFSDDKYPPVEGFEKPSDLDVNRGPRINDQWG